MFTTISRIKIKSHIVGQWPWHVALYSFQDVRTFYRCGGTLISQFHVITAAHCVTVRTSSSQLISISYLGVYIGKMNLKGHEDFTQYRGISKIYLHPNYNATLYFNDIAILKLTQPAKFTKFVRPCCLWDGNTNLDLETNRIGRIYD